MNFQVLLFYQYCHINDVPLLFLWQQSLARKLELKGRILISDEGINGTVSGSKQACKEYIKEVKKYGLFSQINFKTSLSSFLPFDSLQIKIKDEIVTLREDKNKISFKNSANRLSADEFHAILEKKYAEDNKEIIILDTRNAYESRIGKFNQAICPTIENSRHFRQYFQDNHNLFNDKIVLMYCTGGVRCERISALLNDCVKPKEVYHLENGIHGYCQKFPKGFFRGKNYVFDDRISIAITDDILTHCDICFEPCDLYNNCLNAICNKHYISCDSCLKKLHGCCSQECILLTQNKKVPLRPRLKSRSYQEINHG